MVSICYRNNIQGSKERQQVRIHSLLLSAYDAKGLERIGGEDPLWDWSMAGTNSFFMAAWGGILADA